MSTLRISLAAAIFLVTFHGTFAEDPPPTPKADKKEAAPPVTPPQSGEQLITRTYRVVPSALESEVIRAVNGGKIPAGATVVIRQEDIKKFFTDAGVPFTPGAGITYSRSTNTLIVTNTAANLDTVERILEVINQAPPQVTIEVQMLKIPRTLANEVLKDEGTSRFQKFEGLSPRAIRRFEEQVEQKKATVIGQPKVIASSGSQADTKSAREVGYPTSYKTEDGAVIPAEFTNREVGTLLNAHSP